MRILITGANGYIGKHVVKRLLDRGHEVVACDIHPFEIDSRVHSCAVDLLGANRPTLESVGNPDVCIHLAWRDGFVHNSKNHLGDLSAHFRLLTGWIDEGLKQLVVMGSMHEVGYHEGMICDDTPCNPLSQYGIAKNALRQALTIYSKDKCILQWLRGYYILGDDRSNHSIFTKLLDASDSGKKHFPFTTGKTKYDFIDINDLADMIAAVSCQKQIDGIINVCSGQPVSLADKVEEYIAKNNLDIRLDYGAYPDRPYDSPIVYGDPSKINTILSQTDEVDN